MIDCHALADHPGCVDDSLHEPVSHRGWRDPTRPESRRMLSYRHGFHAGNHADVLKHLVQVHLLDYLAAKDKSFWYIDTHAGAGRYALNNRFATRNGEYDSGIGKLWDTAPLPPALQRYLDIVREINPGGALRHYPGSPWFARSCLRAQDRLWLHELHGTDSALLEKCLRNSPVPAHVAHSDGFAALKAYLPPPPRRALVMIDPSYELRADYAQLLASLREALARFATGVYLVWYPMIPRREAHELPTRLANLSKRPWLRVSLWLRAPQNENAGLYGSGVFVVNPPFTLRPALEECMPVLRSMLDQENTGGFTIDTSP